MHGMGGVDAGQVVNRLDQDLADPVRRLGDGGRDRDVDSRRPLAADDVEPVVRDAGIRDDRDAAVMLAPDDRAPRHRQHLDRLLIDHDHVADAQRLVELERRARDQAADRRLGRKPHDGGHDERRRQQRGRVGAERREDAGDDDEGDDRVDDAALQPGRVAVEQRDADGDRETADREHEQQRGRDPGGPEQHLRGADAPEDAIVARERVERPQARRRGGQSQQGDDADHDAQSCGAPAERRRSAFIRLVRSRWIASASCWISCVPEMAMGARSLALTLAASAAWLSSRSGRTSVV